MTSEEYLEFVEITLIRVRDMIKDKNHDYTGDGSAFKNFEQSIDLGVDPLVGLSIRMGDKFERIKTFCKKGNLHVKGEGVSDAFMDIIGYSLLALGMLEENKRLQKSN